MNKKTTQLLLVILIIVTIAFMVFMVFWLRGEGLSCVKDPISYYVKKTSRVCFCENILR